VALRTSGVIPELAQRPPVLGLKVAGRDADVAVMPRIAGLAISFAFIGIAFLAGHLAHSNTVFVTVMVIGLMVRLVLRMATR
jgi:UDP-N-acetylmuramyl pentapeptide phosphotransferase/UDP-N-acetylglucosamine-1-phosphate transferase